MRAQHNTLGAKLVLLSLHFPRLRVIWSRSLHATVDLFRALKANQDEPDAAAAAAIGAHSNLHPQTCHEIAAALLLQGMIMQGSVVTQRVCSPTCHVRETHAHPRT